jgi:hypothetical protein
MLHANTSCLKIQYLNLELVDAICSFPKKKILNFL